MTNPAKPTLWSEDKPNVTTVIPELAEEIGLNESLVLRQIVFWINTSDNLRDGEWWTYQSLSDMKAKAFPYFSVSTLSRTVNKLVDKGLINKTDKYNKRKNDRTQWFSLNLEGIALLKSVKLVLQGEKSPKATDDSILQNETTILHIEKPMLQNETTLPDYKPDYKPQTVSETVDKSSDGFLEKRKALDEIAVLTTPTDFMKFKADADDYTLAQWQEAVSITKQRHKDDGKHKNYNYVLSIVKGLVAEAKQAEVVEAETKKLEESNIRAWKTQQAMKAELDSFEQRESA